MFGRRKKKESAAAEEAERSDADIDTVDEDAALDVPVGAVDGGPYDIDDLPEDEEPAATRLDLGSVLVPIPTGAQLQVEMAQDGTPQAVHLVTQFGRITVSAYAAPRSAGQWREVAAELAESLRKDNAQVAVEGGPWGREVVGVTPNADLRFIGVDGPRWMIRCVVAGPSGNVAVGSPLVEIARTVLRGTVVKRGTEPHPVRTPLPVVLPKVLVEQLRAAQQQQQQAAQQAAQAAQGQAAQGQPAQAGQVPDGERPAPQGGPSGNGSEPPRRGESGSAMQQLGL